MPAGAASASWVTSPSTSPQTAFRCGASPSSFSWMGRAIWPPRPAFPPTHFLTRASCGATPSMTGRGTSRGSLTSGSGASSGAPPSMTPCASTTSGLSTATGPSPLARRMPGRAIGRMDRGWSSSMPCKNPPPNWSSLRRTWGTWGPKPCSLSVPAASPA